MGICRAGMLLARRALGRRINPLNNSISVVVAAERAVVFQHAAV